MRGKRIAALALMGALAAGGTASATDYPPSACTDGHPADHHNADTISVSNPATGGHIYSTRPSGPSGFIGTHGSTGYIEAGGAAGIATKGYIEGQTQDGRVGGRIHNESGILNVCVTANGTTVSRNL